MTTIELSTKNLQFVQLFEDLAIALNVPFEIKENGSPFSISMQRALDDEREGRITKLVNHKDAVSEILG